MKCFLLALMLPVLAFSCEIEELTLRIVEARHVVETRLRDFHTPTTMEDIYYLHGKIVAFDAVLEMIEALD